MTKPVAKRTFHIRNFKPHYVEVFVWATVQEVTDYFHKHHKVSESVIGTEFDNGEGGTCAAFHHPIEAYEELTLARVHIPVKLSQMHFCLEHWGIEIVSHEITHLLFHMLALFGVSALTAMVLEEKWCYAIGDLNERVAAWLHELDTKHKDV